MISNYKTSYRLRTDDYSCHDYVNPYAILDVMQDIAGSHVDSLGAGYEDLKKMNILWVVLRERYVVKKRVPLYANFNVTTYPKKKNLVDYDREYVIKDDDGNALIEAISKWVVVDKDTRRIIPAKRLPFDLSTDEKPIFDNIDKLQDFDIDGASVYTYKIEYNDFDHNGHVNNTKYAYMVSNALKLKEDEEIIDYQIDFLHEIHIHA